MPLTSKISRAIFIFGIAITFLVIHFTDLLESDGLDFDRLAGSIAERPFVIIIYIGMLIVPALICSIIIPTITKWIKSGT